MEFPLLDFDADFKAADRHDVDDRGGVNPVGVYCKIFSWDMRDKNMW